MNPFDIEKLEDHARKLPIRSRHKLPALVDASVAAMAARSNASDTAREAHREFADARFAFLHRWDPVEESCAPTGEPIFTKVKGRREEEPSYQFDSERDRLVEKWHVWQRRKTAYEKATAAYEGHIYLTAVLDWFRNNPGPFTSAAMPPAKLGKGQTHYQAVEDIRERLIRIDEKIAATDSAPALVEDLVARAHAEVDDLARQGSTTIYPTSRDGSPLNLAGSGRMTGQTGILPEALVWLLADELKAAVAAKIRAVAPKDGMSDFDRAAELSALAADKLALERLEEAHIVAAYELGQPIPRRREANPRAILEIEA